MSCMSHDLLVTYHTHDLWWSVWGGFVYLRGDLHGSGAGSGAVGQSVAVSNPGVAVSVTRCCDR